MPFQTWIGTTTLFCALQFDVITTSLTAPQAHPTLPAAKTFRTSPLADGKGYRCLIFGLDQTFISGVLIVVFGTITAFQNVVAANADGGGINLTLTRISSPKNCKVSQIKKV